MPRMMPPPGRACQKRRSPPGGARRAGLLALCAAALLAAGCNDQDPAPAADPAGPQDEPALIAARTVAAFLGIDAAEVRLVEIEERIFADASLDCPEPGMAYAQVLTPGHRVIVEAEGRRFDVRVAGRHGKICQRPRATPRSG